ncbi:MAG: TolC family protein, partial [Saprospiraceae bacterium]
VRGIELEAANARTQYENATQRLASRQKNLDLARRIYETTRIKYREGVGSSLEVTQAEQSLYTAQADFRQALYDRIVARESVFKALGVE